MRTAIIGAGGIGGYLGANLLGADRPVTLIARGAHLRAIREQGLRLSEPEGDTLVRPEVTDDPSGAGQADLVILAVKGQDLPRAIELARPLVGGGTRLLPFQNGVEASDLVAEAYGRDAALTGVARILANITAPGVVTRYGDIRSFTIGDAQGRQDDPLVAGLRATLKAAGVLVPDCADVRVDQWTKFLMFNAISSLTAAARCRLDEIQQTPELWDMAARLVAETAAVARARGVALPAEAEEKVIAAMAAMPPEARASTAHDLEQGKPLEIDWICGAVARLGEAAGVQTPLSRVCHAILSPWKHGRPGG
ncbi:2-dehydropantoate 2-reductase [Rhodobacteraceae bacterium 2CG4]|uniref:2-dehydropantoate 2-reductase n=1 Tax=Halovulum marinum TaxID=2662447 RepID=A0A6L5Z3D3_9RHOB|nr:2-dehydropantoate 2-reductase [Halovulum marinum]MSU91058.1 2-dehydropantoate 2-reductase [Halovulum marinum]